MLIAVFEDEVAANFHPLTLNKPIYMLRCGATMIYEKMVDGFGGKCVLFTREPLSKVVRDRASGLDYVVGVDDLEALALGGDVLLVNGRWLFDGRLLRIDDEVLAVKGGELVYAHVKGANMRKLVAGCGGLSDLIKKLRSELSTVRLDDAELLRYPWDLIEHNHRQLRRDFERVKSRGSWREELGMPGVYLVGEKEDLLISRTARVYPCTVLDSSEGPIIIDDDAVIMPHSYVKGPCYIGKRSWITGGKISGTSIGPVCRVGGEVEDSIIHGFSNKYHAGFLGHSYVGEWVNLGALTTTSDLKNDYSSVEVPVGGRLVNSGKIKVGAFIGDHSKTSIGSLLATGSVIGVMCNLVTSGEPYPKYVPSFTWYVKGQVRDWIDVELMIKSAERMMSRRGVKMSHAEKILYRQLYEETRAEREEFARRLLRGSYQG